MGGNPFRKRALWTLGRQKEKKKKRGKKVGGGEDLKEHLLLV